MNNLLMRLGSIADLPGDDEETLLRHRILIYAGILMSGGGLLWGTISLIFGLYWVSTVPFGYIVITVVNFFLLYIFRNFRVARTVQIIASLLLPFGFQWVLGGFLSSGGMMLWSLLALIGSLTIDDRRSVWIWLGLFGALTIVSGFLEPYLITPEPIQTKFLQTVFYVVNVVTVTSVVFFLTVYFARDRERALQERKRAEEGLIEAKRRSDQAGRLVEEKNRMLESLSNQLSKYLSPQVYDSIFSGEQSVEIASKRKKLTIFFSDIANFTGTTDSLESEELTNLLNHYLTEMSKIALDHGATIDKYVGDSIIAFFGDPESRGVKEDAIACVNMAVAMQRRMRELQSEWLDMGLERPFQQRIGINTGFCTVGNFGSADRMDYTIIGNEVNLAARLEAQAEVGGTLLAHETYSLVKDAVMVEEGETMTVKGFAKPVRTYNVVDLHDDLAAEGRIIHKEQDGVRILVDTKKSDKAAAIRAIEDVLSQLKH